MQQPAAPVRAPTAAPHLANKPRAIHGNAQLPADRNHRQHEAHRYEETAPSAMAAPVPKHQPVTSRNLWPADTHQGNQSPYLAPATGTRLRVTGQRPRPERLPTEASRPSHPTGWPRSTTCRASRRATARPAGPTPTAAITARDSWPASRTAAEQGHPDPGPASPEHGRVRRRLVGVL